MHIIDIKRNQKAPGAVYVYAVNKKKYGDYYVLEEILVSLRFNEPIFAFNSSLNSALTLFIKHSISFIV